MVARLAAVMARGGAKMGISSSGEVREKYCRACLPLDRPQPTYDKKLSNTALHNQELLLLTCLIILTLSSVIFGFEGQWNVLMLEISPEIIGKLIQY